MKRKHVLDYYKDFRERILEAPTEEILRQLATDACMEMLKEYREFLEEAKPQDERSKEAVRFDYNKRWLQFCKICAQNRFDNYFPYSNFFMEATRKDGYSTKVQLEDELNG